MGNAGFQTCHADLSILSSMVLAKTSKRFSIINVDFNIVGYLLIRYSEYFSCSMKKEYRRTLCLLPYKP